MTTLHVVPKQSTLEEIKERVVDILQEYLEKAKAGEIEGLIIIAKRPDETWQHRYSGVMQFTDMIGKLEVIQQDLIEAYRNEP